MACCKGAIWLALILATGMAHADPAEIVAVKATLAAGGWRFEVTLRHDDTGWDDYADGWRVELPDGTVLGTRDLLHPHADEQPFTRALGSVTIPPDAEAVRVRARTNVTGWDPETRRVPLQ